HVLGAADAAAQRERDEEPLRGAARDLEQGLAALDGGRDVEEHDLVGPLDFVPLGELHRVAHVAQADELGALDDPARGHVQAGDDPAGQHGEPASGAVMVACPLMCPARPATPRPWCWRAPPTPPGPAAAPAPAP